MAITMKDIAKKLKITEPAVSMALRGYPNISPEMIEKVRKTAKKLGYRPNLAARNLRKKQSKVIGFAFPDISYDYSQKIVEGAKSVLEDKDCIPMIALTSWNTTQEEKEIDVLLGYQAEGIICLPVVGSERVYKRVIRQGVPLVFVGNGLDLPEASWVGLDNSDAMNKIVKHLAGQGHKKIACIVTDIVEESLAQKEFLDAYLESVDRFGLVKENYYIIKSHVGDSLSVDKCVRGLMLSDSRPTAIVSISDVIAYQVLETLCKLGIDVPGDCAVTGIGDIAPSRFEAISLTTVHEDAFRLGVIAAQNLIEQMDSEQYSPITKKIKGNLIVRKSSVGCRVI